MQISAYQGSLKTNQAFYDAEQAVAYLKKIALQDLKNRFVGKTFYLPYEIVDSAKRGYILDRVSITPNFDWEFSIVKSKDIKDINLSQQSTIHTTLKADGFHAEDDSIIRYIADLPDQIVAYSYDNIGKYIDDVYHLYKSYEKALEAYETLQRNDSFQTTVAGKTFYIPFVPRDYDGNPENAIITIHFSSDGKHLTLTFADNTTNIDNMYFNNNTVYLKDFDSVYLMLIGKTDKYLHIFTRGLPIPTRFFLGMFYTKTDAVQYLQKILPTK